ncbi:MAG: glycosyltransferase, partial [Planctomycetes bacterium]|nr:glycosyltransferase [Planctomycetota bacterium]
MRGGEKCLEVFCRLFPDATLFTLLHVKGSVSPAIERMDIRASFIQRLPFAARRYRHYLPLFPRAVESFDLRGYDLVLSSSHCAAKGARPAAGATHVCYLFTPMRYVWDMYDDYFGRGRTGRLAGAVIALAARRLRRWDVATASRVSRFVAISRFVRERVRAFYHRDADVIYPPVNAARFRPRPGLTAPGGGDYYLVVSAFAPYKRLDLALAACRRLDRRLVIVGSGQDEARLRLLAGPRAEFLGWRGDDELAGLYAGCRALLFPGVEDFGITPLEAMASGRPVIAYGRGGARETVVDEEEAARTGAAPTGLFFREQTVDSLVEGIRAFEAREQGFDPAALRRRALEFDQPVFESRIRDYLLSGGGGWG